MEMVRKNEKNVRFERVFIPALMALGLMGGVSGLTYGQIQVQQHGTALDANPQAGTGGSNTPVPGYVPINGNDIITGNVAGLKYFHGQTATGTFSPYVFRGQQGSADFNNFARQSAPPSAGNYSAQSFYLPSTTVSTGQGSLYSAPTGSGFDSALAPTYSAAPTSNIGNIQSSGPVSQGIAIRQYGATPTTNDMTTTTGGDPILTSPLFGVRPQPVPGQALSVSLTPTGSQDTDNSSGANGNGGANGNSSGGTNGPASNGLYTPPDRGSNLAATGSADGTANGGASAARGKSVLDSATPQPTINDAYRNLLNSLGQNYGEPKVSGATGTTGNQTGPSDANKPANSGTATPAGSGPGTDTKQLTAPTDRTANRPEIDRRTGKPVTAGALNQDGTAREMGTQSTDPTKPGYRPRSRIMLRSQLESIPDSALDAGKKVEPLKTFSSLPPGGGGLRLMC